MQFHSREDVQEYFTTHSIEEVLKKGLIVRLLNTASDKKDDVSGTYYQIINETNKFITLREIKRKYVMVFETFKKGEYDVEVAFYNTIHQNSAKVQRGRGSVLDLERIEEFRISKSKIEIYNIIAPDNNYWDFNKTYFGKSYLLSRC